MSGQFASNSQASFGNCFQLKGCQVHSTPASVETGVPNVGIHIPKPATYSVERMTDISFYSLANTPILYNKLCIESIHWRMTNANQ